MIKNTASQKIAVFAWDTLNDTEKTGDAANITAQISLDGGVTAASNDVNPTELDATDAPGIYLFDMTQAETNADKVVFFAVSATAYVSIEPIVIWTISAAAPAGRTTKNTDIQPLGLRAGMGRMITKVTA